MSFFGCQFVFDDIPSWEYGLVIYDLGGANEDGDFTTPAEIVEDRINNRYTPLHYGVKRNEPLKFQLHFGADPRSVDKRQWLDRWEIDTIASWLTEHDDYKYLEIFQQDLDVIRYKCIITELTYSSYGKYPWAFTCEVTCDSPYAYLVPETYSYTFKSTTSATRIGANYAFRNLASPKYYRPKIKISNITNVKNISICCHGDSGHEFILNNLTGVGSEINVDNEHEVLTCSSGLNIYDRIGDPPHFFRLVKGLNSVDIYVSPTTVNKQFTVTVDFICEFPINVGG